MEDQIISKVLRELSLEDLECKAGRVSAKWRVLTRDELAYRALQMGWMGPYMHWQSLKTSDLENAAGVEPFLLPAVVASLSCFRCRELQDNELQKSGRQSTAWLKIQENEKLFMEWLARTEEIISITLHEATNHSRSTLLPIFRRKSLKILRIHGSKWTSPYNNSFIPPNPSENLQVLELCRCDFLGADWGDLRDKCLPKLEKLSITDGLITREGASMIVQLELPSLRELTIYNRQPRFATEEKLSLADLAKASFFRNLTALRLSEICVEGFSFSELPRTLQLLLFSNKDAEPTAVPNASNFGHLSNLKELRVCGAGINGYLPLPKLESLSMYSGMDTRSFVSSYGQTLSSLKRLTISHSTLNLDSALDIASLPNLEVLKIDGCFPSFASVEPIFDGKFASKLRRLEITGTPLAARGLRRLVRSFRNLEELTVDGCSLDSFLLGPLTELKKLRCLDVSSNSPPQLIAADEPGDQSADIPEHNTQTILCTDLETSSGGPGRISSVFPGVEDLNVSQCSLLDMHMWNIAIAFPRLRRLQAGGGWYTHLSHLKPLAGTLKELAVFSNEELNAENILALPKLKVLHTYSMSNFLKLLEHESLVEVFVYCTAVHSDKHGAHNVDVHLKFEEAGIHLEFR
ncbi:hypothetical protein NDN08_005174 [Rhodosorus marinus]|uniref:F-box domain-containing protein n=1 Tax=Rhodosorus marinus TaxID=101924 RepID=A0AAV8V0S4_9RHOD|nr:hypothetical protein NDN08_005174 [Rhodosorus marinus]